MSRLVADGLAKRFGRRLLFRDLALTVEGGQSLAITGANGTGKSTPLGLLAGVVRPSAGTVRLWHDGRALKRAERPLRSGLVAPYLHVYGGFTARENLRFLARARRLSEAEERIEAALRRVGLAERAGDPVRTFSSGLEQRVKYAAALLATPLLLLLDEPAANLDEAGLAMVEDVTGEWRAAGRVVVVATNRPETATRCDDQLCVEDFAP
jgi:heme exporter protein A